MQGPEEAHSFAPAETDAEDHLRSVRGNEGLPSQ